MKEPIYACLLLLLAAGIAGCSGNGRRTDLSSPDSLYTPAYAKGYDLAYYGRNTVLTIHDPWQGARDVSMSLFLSRDGAEAPDGFAGRTISVPVKNTVCLSSSHIAFLDALGQVGTVRGVSGAKFITNDSIRAGYDAGRIADLGYDANMNYERLAALRPDIIFIYGVAGENGKLTNKLDELNLPYLYIGDYLEYSPLGKTEWIKVFGELTDRHNEASRLFGRIAAAYDSIRMRASEAGPKPKVMLNAPYRDTWFVPGDRSYMVALIRDAGGCYVCEGVDSEISRPLSGEAAYVALKGSDIWLNPNMAASIDDLKGENPKFTEVKAVRDGRVWNCNRRSTPRGGSDFWESGAVRADIVLADLFHIFHPAASVAYQPYYYRRLE